MKQALIIPGFLQGPMSPSMRHTAAMFGQIGAQTKIAKIHWAGNTLTDWLQEIDLTLCDINIADTTVVGFSYGAMIAAMVASRQTPMRLVLCSMSEYWAEDLPKLKLPWWERALDKRRLQDFHAYRFSTIAPMIACPTTIFVGEKEAARSPYLMGVAEDAHRLIEGSVLEVIPRAGHSLNYPGYRQALAQLAVQF